MSERDIRFRLEDGVATIELHRPEQRNAFSGQMGVELGNAYRRCDADDAVRAIVLTGTQLLNLAALPIANLAVLGNAFIDATYAITFNGMTGSLHLVGAEVSRVVVPEPQTAGLLALGVFALAGWRAARSRR